MSQKWSKRQAIHSIFITPIHTFFGFLISIIPIQSYAHISADQAWNGFVSEYSAGRVHTLVDYVALLADAEAFADTPQQVQFKSASLQYFLTTGGPNGFLKPENCKKSAAQQRIDQDILKKAAIYVGMAVKQKKEDFDVFAVRNSYIASPISQPIETHFEVLQIIIFSAIHGGPVQIAAKKASAEGNLKESGINLQIFHPVFKKYNTPQITAMLTANFEAWTETYQTLFSIHQRIEPGLIFQALPVRTISPDTVVTFSLKSGKITWQESTATAFTANIAKQLSQETQTYVPRIHPIVKLTLNTFFQGQLLQGNTDLILEGDIIELPGIIAAASQFIIVKPHNNNQVPLRAILLRRLLLQPYPITFNGHINFNASGEPIVKDFAVNGCRVLLGCAH